MMLLSASFALLTYISLAVTLDLKGMFLDIADEIGVFLDLG